MEKVSLDISRKEELSEKVRSFSILYESHKGFKEKDAMKNGWDGRNSVEIYSGTISFIWLNSQFNLFSGDIKDERRALVV